MYTVLRDTQEQEGWIFSKSSSCNGTIEIKLPTGDYTLQGYDKLFVIERKGSTGEFAKNIVENRFEAELLRLEHFPHPFIVLEFTMDDIIKFPLNSGIPKHLWRKLRITSFYMLKRLIEYELKYKTQIILAGTHGKDVASSIFKRIVETYGDKQTEAST